VVWNGYTATLRNTPQHTATHCNTPQHTATHCNTLQHTATHCNTLQHTATHCNSLQHTATHCDTLQHPVAYCNTLQHTTTDCNALQHKQEMQMRSVVWGGSSRLDEPLLRCYPLRCIEKLKTLQQAATYCITLQNSYRNSEKGLRLETRNTNTWQHTAPHSTALYHTAPHCATLYQPAPL